MYALVCIVHGKEVWFVYVEHIYWGYNYANNANKQKGPALGLIQSVFTVSQWGYLCTAPVCHPGTNTQHIFSIKINNPICVTERLFQPQRQSCGCHSKSRITTAINLVVLSKGVSVFAQTHTCMVKTFIVHTSQFLYQAKLVKLCFLHLTNCILLYVPDDAHSWTKQRHCEDTPTGLFLKRKGWFCSFSCKCCSCVVVITILEFKVALLDGAVFHGSISVLSHIFYWATSLKLTVIKLNGQQNSVWKNQVNTTCLCSDGTVIWATVLHGSLRNHYSYSIIFHSSAPCCSFPVSTTYHSLLNQTLEKNTKKKNIGISWFTNC